MNIHQLSVHHDERQDRLLLRLNTLDHQEFRFWLTRRMTVRLMPAIEQSAVRLEAAQPGVAASDAQSQHLLTELKRDAFLEKADFATPFENYTTERPLGDEPMLITDAHLSIQPGGALEISFEDKSDTAQTRSCKLHLPVNLVHGMVHLIQQASKKAEWVALDSNAKVPDTAPELPRYAH